MLIPSPVLRRFAGALLTFFLAFFSLSSGADEVGKVYRSPDRQGKGNAGLSVPEDEDALLFNPSGLYQGGESGVRKWVFLSPYIVASEQALKLKDVGSDDTKLLKFFRDSVGDPIDVSVDQFSGLLIGNMGFGLLANAAANLLVYKDSDRSGVEAVDLSVLQDVGFFAGSSYGLLGKQLTLGTTLKVVRRSQTKADITIADVDAIKNFSLSDYQNKGTGFGMDLAATWKMTGLLTPSFSLVISDIGNTSFKGSDDKFAMTPMRQSVNLGSSISPPLPFGDLNLSADLHDLLDGEKTSRLKGIHMGLEYIVWEQLGFLGGLNQGYGTMGIYYKNGYFRLDAGSFAEEVGDRVGERPSRRTYIRIMSTYTPGQSQREAPGGRAVSREIPDHGAEPEAQETGVTPEEN